MDQLFEIAVLAIIAMVLVSRLYTTQAERKNLRNVWKAFGTTYGWQVLPRPEPATANDAAIVIAGVQANRHVQVSAYRHYFKRTRPEYMEIIVELNIGRGD